jgi:hypothetical protein
VRIHLAEEFPESEGHSEERSDFEIIGWAYADAMVPAATGAMVFGPDPASVTALT